jgi:folate-binding protein YgfZ
MAGGRVIQIDGADRETFLQGLVSNDLRRLDQGPVYAALLSPQGKYLADFFLLRHGDSLLLDIAPALAEATLRRLAMYRLRADVRLSDSPLSVGRTFADEGVPDPRHPALGRRVYAPGATDEAADWDALRVAHCIPESAVELVPDDSYILESGFERLHGVDFRKGCYVGQEVTARMKHKTELRKGLVTVALDGAAPVGTEILADGKPAGRIFTQAGGRGIAHLRFDRAEGPMTAGDAAVTWDGRHPS